MGEILCCDKKLKAKEKYTNLSELQMNCMIKQTTHLLAQRGKIVKLYLCLKNKSSDCHAYLKLVANYAQNIQKRETLQHILKKKMKGNKILQI